MERRFGIMKTIGKTVKLAYLRILTKVFEIVHTIARSENSLTSGKCTNSDRFIRELNHNESPNSKG